MKKRYYQYIVVCLLLVLGNMNLHAQRGAQELEVAPLMAHAEKSSQLVAAMKRVGYPAAVSDDIFLQRAFYATAFSKPHCEAKWVMWALTPDMLGQGKRAPFVADNELPFEYRVDKGEYSGSGYSRGHMMPAGDCKFSSVASVECAYMSNMCPQTDKLNAGPWNSLEMKCREWAKVEDTIFIVCGPIYRSSKPKKIGTQHAVDVPDAFFKVVLSLKKGNEKMVGFVFDNNDAPEKMQQAVCPVKDIEKLTGITFFPRLPEKQAKTLKASADLSVWKMPKQTKNANYQSAYRSDFKSNYQHYSGKHKKKGKKNYHKSKH